jgi:mannose-6-phosphate isomerase-like protein (cupin superfamily)
MRILAGADSTDGSFSLVEATEEPGRAAPLHVHHGEAEALYVIDGTIDLTCGEETVTAGTGDFVCTPKDVPHKYAVVGERPAGVLLLFSQPGLERLFVEAGAPFDEPQAGLPEPEQVRRLIEKYDLGLLEPLGH